MQKAKQAFAFCIQRRVGPAAEAQRRAVIAVEDAYRLDLHAAPPRTQRSRAGAAAASLSLSIAGFRP
jgi:hypothetical protein